MHSTDLHTAIPLHFHRASFTKLNLLSKQSHTYWMCKIKARILILALVAQTLITACPFYTIRHTKKITKIPQLYKRSILYSGRGETARPELDYNKTLLGETLGRAPKDFAQHPVAGSPYRQAFSPPQVTFIRWLETLRMNPTSLSTRPSSC